MIGNSSKHLKIYLLQNSWKPNICSYLENGAFFTMLRCGCNRPFFLQSDFKHLFQQELTWSVSNLVIESVVHISRNACASNPITIFATCILFQHESNQSYLYDAIITITESHPKLIKTKHVYSWKFVKITVSIRFLCLCIRYKSQYVVIKTVIAAVYLLHITYLFYALYLQILSK